MFGRKLIAYNVGDIIEQACFGMLDCKRLVLVTDKDGDIKNGRPGFGGKNVNEAGEILDKEGWGVWGYDTDVVRVVRRGA